jgi:hypothetical protein
MSDIHEYDDKPAAGRFIQEDLGTDVGGQVPGPSAESVAVESLQGQGHVRAGGLNLK